MRAMSPAKARQFDLGSFPLASGDTLPAALPAYRVFV